MISTTLLSEKIQSISRSSQPACSTLKKNMRGPAGLHPRPGTELASPVLMQGIKVPNGLKATGSMDALIEHADFFLMVVPTPFVAATVGSMKDKLKPHQVKPAF